MSGSPPAKCRRPNIDENKIFSEPPTIGDHDLFSTLPDDCLLEIFAFVEHPDLDAVSVVSQRLHPLTIRSRPNVRSGTVEKIRIIRRDETKHSLSLFFSKQWITTKTFCAQKGIHANCEYCSSLLKKYQNDPSIPVLHSLFDIIPKAFKFNTIEYESVIIGDMFIALCKQFFDVPCKRRVFHSVEIDPTISGQNPEYFRIAQVYAWMAKGCLEELEIASDNLAQLYPCFVLDRINAGISSVRIVSTSTPKQFTNDDRLLPLLRLCQCRRLANLDFDFLQFVADSVFPGLLECYRLHRPGQWRFISDAEPVITGIFSPLGLIISRRTDGALELCLNGQTEITVKITALDINPNLFSVEATFH